jgi:hypothetical protein
MPCASSIRGPLPHPLAASTDISKVVRLEYGADEAYTELAEQAIAGWRRWNRELGAELFHESGLLFLRRTPLSPGTLEQDSLDVLHRRGHRVEVLDANAIRSRFSCLERGATFARNLQSAGRVRRERQGDREARPAPGW